MPEEDLQKQCEALKKSLVILVENTQLAAALVAVNVSLRDDPPYTHRIEGGRDIVTWHFHDTSDDKKVLTLELVKAFKNDVQYTASNPNTPFTYALMAIKNYRLICDWIDTNPKPLGCYSESELPNTVLVNNPQLAAALLTVGAQLSRIHPWGKRHNGVIEWRFKSNGDVDVLELVKAFKNETEWTANNPMNPFTFAMHAIKNLQIMTGWIRENSKPFLVYKSPTGKQRAFVIKGSRRERKCIENGYTQV